jgi:transposase
LDRRKKVELFEQIRREYEHGAGTIRAVAKELGVHRRLVRHALADAQPPERKRPERKQPQLEPVKDFIDAILEADRHAPRKQRHTAHRIYLRIRREKPEATVSESTVRRYAAWKKQSLSCAAKEVSIQQSYAFGEEAQVDWYEAYAEFSGDRQKVNVFCMRSMASGAAFHCAYFHATQQAFLEAHESAFAWFGGVFARLRYDNLRAAVKKVLRGHRREETERFIVFRSHWGFQAEFCNPAEAQEKGGVEGEVGYFRRNHFVPIPQVRDLADLNRHLLQECAEDGQRRIGDRSETTGALMIREREFLVALPKQGVDLTEVSFPTVDSGGCVTVRTNRYSTPLRPGMTAQAKLHPAYVEIWSQGERAARHERCYQRRQQILDLEHYLEPLRRKPGALAGSTALAQWREQQRWKESHDRLWQVLNARHGRQNGTRFMVDVIRLGREHGYQRLENTIERALALGCSDVEAIRYLLLESRLERARPEAVQVPELMEYDRPLASCDDYDCLLSGVGVRA